MKHHSARSDRILESKPPAPLLTDFGITDPALSSVGVKLIEVKVNTRLYVQCVTCRRAWLPPLGRELPPDWWECPNGCNAPPVPKRKPKYLLATSTRKRQVRFGAGNGG